MMSRVIFCASLAVACAGVAFAWQNAPAPTPAASIPASAIAQLPPPAPQDTLRIKTNVGSFKIVGKGPSMPSGRLEFAFKGTVLVSGLEPGSYLKTTGNVRREYFDEKQNKQVFFGNGRVLLVGRFRGCQWFGRNLDFTFKGSAVVRTIAEFDSKLETGFFWFNESAKEHLQTRLIGIEVPSTQPGPTRAITREEFEAEKKKLRGGG